jgi:hypothetical protein
MEDLIKKNSNLNERVSKGNPEYVKVKKLISKLETNKSLSPEQIEELKTLKTKLIKIPSVIRDDSTATRVYYNRYADD